MSDEGPRRTLRRHRFAATGLLALMAAGFVATHFVPADAGLWLGIARAMTEAALVGGIADWFAVTALFRRPLGLPIPHTALVPRQKARIGEGLGRFVETNFLAPEALAAKIRSVKPAGRAAAWLAHPDNAALVAERLLAAIPYLLRSAQDRSIRSFLRGALERQLAGLDLAPLLGSLLRLLTERGHHQALFDRVLHLAARWLTDHREEIRDRVARQTGWWVPKSVDASIADRLVAGIAELLGELAQPEHEMRLRFDAELARIAEGLRSSPDYAAMIAGLKAQFLADPEVGLYLERLWDRARGLVLADLSAERSTTRAFVAEALASFGQHLARDEAMQARLDGAVESFLLGSVVPWRGAIGRFIAETVDRWDSRTIVDRLELAVGRDLQYIRINGTLVGGAIGVALYLLSNLGG